MSQTASIRRGHAIGRAATRSAPLGDAETLATSHRRRVLRRGHGTLRSRDRHSTIRNSSTLPEPAMLKPPYPYYLANEAGQPNDRSRSHPTSTPARSRRAWRWRMPRRSTPASRRQSTRRSRDGSDAAVCSARRCSNHCVARFRERYRRTRDGAVHRGRQADQGCARRSHATDRYVSRSRPRSRCASTAKC